MRRFPANWSAVGGSILLALFTFAILGCYQETAGVGRGGTGSFSMGGAIQGKPLALTNQVTTIAGSASTVAGVPSSADGIGAAARFLRPSGVATDGTYLYVADAGNFAIRRVEIATGTVTTLAGIPGASSSAGGRDGVGTAAIFAYPIDICTDGQNLYVADATAVRKVVLATAEVTTLAGSGQTGSVDGIGSEARFELLTGIATDGTHVYVVDALNHTIRKIEIATGAVTTFAGSPGFGGMVDATGTAARFSSPEGIATDGTNLYVTDGSSIRRIALATGEVTTLQADTGTYLRGIATDGENLYLTPYSHQDNIFKVVISSCAVSTLAGPPSDWGSRLATDGTSLYLAVADNNIISRIDIASGAITTLAGTSIGTDGIGAAASFSQPHGVTTDGPNLYVTEYGNNSIRKVVIATREVTTLAGIYDSSPAGFADGIGSAARFASPGSITTDGVNLYVTDFYTIRKVEIGTGAVTTLAGRAGVAGWVDGVGAAARFDAPSGITTDLKNLYVIDDNKRIRKVDIATGEVTTLVTLEGSTEALDGVENASDHFLSAITTDGTNLYVGDGMTIRKIVISTREVTTLAGHPRLSFSAEGTGTAALFDNVNGLTTDGTNLYVADYVTIRKVVISTGEVTTVAGRPSTIGHSDSTGATASFGDLNGITTDGTSLFVTDTGNSTIRRIQ